MNSLGKVHGSLYVVEPGDTPAAIAYRLTGDARRMNELVARNDQKRRQYVDGWVTFASLAVGEPLWLPPNWQRMGLRGLGALSPTDLQPLVDAIKNDAANLCAATKANPNPRVLAFQKAFNKSTLVNVYGGTATTITEDGLYGKDSSGAAAMVDVSAPAACAHFGVQPGGVGYSVALIAAGKILDTFLSANGCGQCKTGDTASPMATLVWAFKQAALATPGASGTAVATVVPGVTVNTVGAAAYAFGPGTNDLLTAVLGGSRTYKGGACTDSSGNCLGVSPAPSPAPGPAPGPAPSPTPAASSSSIWPWVIGGVVVAGGGYAAYWMKKHPGHMKRMLPRYA